MQKCTHCGGKFEKKMIPYKYKGTYLGKFKGYACSVCHNVYFDEQAFQEIEDVAKTVGIWRKG